MKDVRPSTWIMLGILVLIIFGPLFFLDMELEPAAANAAPAGPGNGIRPSNPFANNQKRPPPGNIQPAANRAPTDSEREPQPPGNTPGDGPVD